MINDKDLVLSEAEWRKRLSPEQYRVMRQRGTEAPFSGKFDQFWRTGKYMCAGCGEELFASKSKYDAGCGWPSFFEAVDKGNIQLTEDVSQARVRTEVRCARCGSHLGHLFADGHEPTRNRY